MIGGYLLIVTLWLIYRFTVEEYRSIEFLVDIPVALLQVIVLLGLSKYLIEYFFLRRGNVLLFVLLGFAGLWGVGFLTMLSGDLTHYGRIPWEQYGTIGDLIIFNVNNSVYNIAIPVLLLSGKKYHEYRLKAIQLLNAQKDLELKVLRAQFDPHFLYNSLNTIDALIDYSPRDKVKEYVFNLAALYRYQIQIKDENVAALETEINLVQHYFYLIETRFKEDYQFAIRNTQNIKDQLLPNGALLTVVENIVKHNKALEGRKIRSTIIIEQEKVVVSNTKMLQAKNTETLGTGLKNLHKRYALLSDQELIIEETEEHFTVILPLLTLVD